MTEVAVSDFRAHIHEYLLKVKLGEKIVLTNRGQEVAKLVPPNKDGAEKKLKEMSKGAIVGDVLAPVENVWELK